MSSAIEAKWVSCFRRAFELSGIGKGTLVAILSETLSRALNVKLAELALLDLGARAFPKSARAYLDDWAATEKAGPSPAPRMTRQIMSVVRPTGPTIGNCASDQISPMTSSTQRVCTRLTMKPTMIAEAENR